MSAVTIDFAKMHARRPLMTGLEICPRCGRAGMAYAPTLYRGRPATCPPPRLRAILHVVLETHEPDHETVRDAVDCCIVPNPEHATWTATRPSMAC